MSSNASASAFGWDFQCNAAIVFALDHLKENLKEVKVEGNIEDIELSFEDGCKIYVQAKAFQNVDEDTNGSEKFKDALRTLNEAAKQNDVKGLVYTTNNIFNPFGTNDKKIDRRTSLYFHELSKKTQEKWNAFLKEQNYDEEKIKALRIEIIPFCGEILENRYKEILWRIEKFLDESLKNNKHSAKIMECLQNKFQHNSTVRESALTKKEIVWSIIVVFCESANDFISDDFFQNDFQGDESLKECVRDKYETLIKSAVDKFQIVSKVFSEYDSFSSGNIRNKRQEFIRSKWELFKENFPIEDH